MVKKRYVTSMFPGPAAAIVDGILDEINIDYLSSRPTYVWANSERQARSTLKHKYPHWKVGILYEDPPHGGYGEE